MLVNGDKLVVVKKVAPFLNEGDVVEVVNVDEDGVISFAFGEGFVHMGVMNASECEAHFEKIEEEIAAPTITSEYIDEIMSNSSFDVKTVFGKCTIVSCRLPNGFVIVESSACVSPENYNEDIGVGNCMKKICDKIWELEGYRLQQHIWETEVGCCCGDCMECNCECEEEFDECLDTDLDCDDCDDINCPYRVF